VSHPGWVHATVVVDGRRLAVRERPAVPGDERSDLVAVFHQSPLSGWTHEPLLDHLDHRGPVVIFDTPGYGGSEPIAQPACLDAYADALWAGVEQLRGDRRVVLVGQHTGAHLAMLLGARRPDVVRGVVFHGISLYTDDERRNRRSGYIAPIPPSADGSHLTAIWERLTGLYPDVATELLDRAVCDYLTADPDYAHAYRAVFDLPVAEPVARLVEAGVPTAVVTGTLDLIADRQDRAAEAFGSPITMLTGLSDFAAWEAPAEFAAAVAAAIASFPVRQTS